MADFPVTSMPAHDDGLCIRVSFNTVHGIRTGKTVGTEIHVNRFMEKSELVCTNKAIGDGEIRKVDLTGPVQIRGSVKTENGTAVENTIPLSAPQYAVYLLSPADIAFPEHI